MDFEVYDTTKAYNDDALRCAQVRDITREDLLAVADRYDRAWLDATASKLKEINKKTNLPRLFDTEKNKGGLSINCAKHSEIISFLNLPTSATVEDICAAAREDMDLEYRIEESIGDGRLAKSPIVNIKTIKNRFEYSDVSFLRNIADSGKCDSILGFLSDICSSSARSVMGIKYESRTVYSLLLAMHAEGIALLPFGIWRDLTHPGKVSNQGHLDVGMSSDLLGIERARDLRVLSEDADKRLGPRHAPQVQRILQSLLVTNFLRVAEYDPDEIIATITSYVSSDQFKARGENARYDAHKLIRVSLGILQRRISNDPADAHSARNISISRLAERGTVPNGISLRYDESKRRTSFSFIEKAAHDLSGWTHHLKMFVDSSSNQRKYSLAAPLVPFCDWLVGHGQDISGPGDLLAIDVLRSNDPDSRTTLLDYLDDIYDEESKMPARVYSAARAFFDWWQPLNDPDALNPLPERHQPRSGEYLGKTSKEGLPVRIIEMMKVIITENDYAFCRLIPEDYVVRGDDDGEDIKIWSPVRAVALLTLLTLPLRSLQGRKLDSGEFDEFIFNEESWSFVENPRGLKGRRQGVFRHFVDFGGDRTGFVGLYINSNKSDDVTRSKKLGYEIKWENRPLLSALCMLRDWQEMYNPVGRLMSINEVADHTLHAPDEAVRRLPKFAFLFRDASSIRASSLDPISPARLSMMFLLVLNEAERRLKADGHPVDLIKKRYPSGRPKEGYVTLHSLRVSGITNFAEFGVPLNVLTEFLAGHSSILMNIWYQKLGFQTVSNVIDTAYARMTPEAVEGQMATWQADFIAVVQGKEVPSSRIHDMVIAEGEVAGQLARISPELWAIGLDGFCPNGRTLCFEGGPRIGTKGWTRPTPVPGGEGNCPRCRFWVTGPMFLAGQVIAANVLLYIIQEKGRRLEDLDDDC